MQREEKKTLLFLTKNIQLAEVPRVARGIIESLKF